MHHKYTRRDGTIMYTRESAIPLFDEDGVFQGYRGVAVDETEAVVVQKKNIESQTRFNFALENLDVGFALWGQDDCLVAYNAYFENLTSDILGKLETGISYEEFMQAWAERGGLSGVDIDPEIWLQQRLDQFSQPRSEIETLHGSGKWLHIVMQKIGDGSTAIFYTDITQLHNRENELREARQIAEIANDAKSDFLSSMSHELRTPMNAILGFGQLLETNPNEKLSVLQEKYVTQILKGGAHLLELIDQVLELSRIEAGKIGISIEAVDATLVVDECLTMLKGRAVSEKIKLINDIAGKPLKYLPNVKADSSRLRQILLNLISNAIKYNVEHGSVTIESDLLDNGFLRLRVVDTGLGMAMEQQSKLFEPFNRLGREGGEIEGTGIGLTITKQYVELLGGFIDFESEEGKGSSFWIDLPIWAMDEENTEDVIDQPNQIASLLLDADNNAPKILYIEDNPSNLSLMVEIVDELLGLKMLSAPTGELGFDLAQEHQPDLILMDINLPGIDGIEVMRKLRRGEATKDIPVIALTAAAMPRDIKRGQEAGFADYVTKPINIPTIIGAIKKALDIE